MQFHELKRKNENRRKTTIGRGGKRGKTSGRGTKGQNARAGRKKRPEIRDIIKKIPKRRGYRFASFAKRAAVISLGQLAEIFPKGGNISPRSLHEKGIIGMEAGFYPRVKILGDGDISAKLTVSGCEVSASAREKIEKAGGSITRKA